MTNTPFPLCNRLIEGYLPPRCTLPAGHDGPHKTTMIPVELSDIAADMMTLHDDLETERTALHVERTTLHVAIDSARRQRKALMLSIGFHFGGFAAWAIAAVVVFQAGVK